MQHMQHIGRIQIRGRGGVWCAIAIGLFALLVVRLWSIQITDHEVYQTEATNRQGRCWPIRAPRGNIYDRNGVPLALNLKLHSVAADPHLVGQPAKLASDLAPLLKMPVRQLTAKLTRKEGARYVLLRDSVDRPVAEAVRALGCDGMIVNTAWKRAYPREHVAAALLGFIGKDSQGLSGIEAAANDRLAGEDGEMLVVLDGRLPSSRDRIPNRTVLTKRMQPGSSVRLTIDLDIQAIAEEELAKAVEKAKAAGGTAIVMDPISGDVLALATLPGFDPNEFQKSSPETWVSRAVVTPYEPGSTFKVIGICAAMEEGILPDGETLYCKGSYEVGGHKIKCSPHGGKRAHGPMDLGDIITKSCNTGMARVAVALGADRMYQWTRRFGFGEKTGIELAGESRGILSRPEKWSSVQLATVGFGQGISVTPLQLLSAYCAVANGGWRIQPRVISAVTGPGGEIERLSRPDPVRILSGDTCERMRAMLVRAVEDGTGMTAQVPGHQVAGKTGTAQKATPGEGYRSDKYVASVAGFAPADRPRLAILVTVDEPRNGRYGATVAAPAFRAICERSLIHLRVPPDRPLPRHEIALAAGGAEPR